MIIFFPVNLTSGFLWIQHRFGGVVAFVLCFVLFCFVLFFFKDLCSLLLLLYQCRNHNQTCKPCWCWALGKQTGKGILWQEYGEAAFHKLILRRLSYIKVKSCIICEKDFISKYDVVVIGKMMFTEFVK